ncbi:MAG: (2E,6E)-farnesyl diphosphate synthase [Thiotrichaceae bacterium]|nr:(2E,6E)-farnesyl diphosphate synthase [Thiotrichaceae bacterium]
MLNSEEATSWLINYQQRIESVLDNILPKADVHPTHLHQAMRYSTLGAGKRIRPSLVYATGKALGVDLDVLDRPAAALELIHVYSLVHDDLPAMDDDDLRRGKPTCHIAFDEATAILVGDALPVLALQLLSEPNQENLSAKQRLAIINVLSIAAGSYGMVGGQALDLSSTGKVLTEPELENMHRYKTGALISAGIQIAIICAQQINTEKSKNLEYYAQCIGLAFQLRDDILDVEGDTVTLGKRQGADQALNKATYPAILGLSATREKTQYLYQQAIEALADFGESAAHLRYIADFIVVRLK